MESIRGFRNAILDRFWPGHKIARVRQVRDQHQVRAINRVLKGRVGKSFASPRKRRGRQWQDDEDYVDEEDDTEESFVGHDSEGEERGNGQRLSVIDEGDEDGEEGDDATGSLAEPDDDEQEDTGEERAIESEEMEDEEDAVQPKRRATPKAKQGRSELNEHTSWLLKEGQRRLNQIQQTDLNGWTADEKKLYRKICMRGFEPLLPDHWRMDFPTIPTIIFTRNDELTAINSACNEDFRAAKALRGLIGLGARIRATIIADKDPSHLIRREIERYIKWASQDGGYAKDKYIPVIAVACPTLAQIANLNDSQLGVVLEAKITRSLDALAERYHEAFTDDPGRTLLLLPTLYGIIISYAVVLVVSYDSNVKTQTQTQTNNNQPNKNNKNNVKTLAVFNFKKYGHDVWNGIAVGICICQARDYLRGLKDDIGFSPDSTQEMLSRIAAEEDA